MFGGWKARRQRRTQDLISCILGSSRGNYDDDFDHFVRLVQSAGMTILNGCVNDQTPLQQAVCQDRLDMAQVLVQHGANVDLGLLWAVLLQNTRLLRFLLSANKREGFLPPSIRMVNDHHDVIRSDLHPVVVALPVDILTFPTSVVLQMLSKQQQQQHPVRSYYSTMNNLAILPATLLHMASQSGHLLHVQMLLDHFGSDVYSSKHGQEYRWIDISDDQGTNALMLACQHGHYHVAELLLKRKARKNLFRKSDGFTALHISVMTGNHDIVALLRKHGVNLGQQTHNGSTALELAIGAGQKRAIVELLGNKDRALIRHCRNWNQEGDEPYVVVEALLEAGANPNTVDVHVDDWTPLHFSVRGNRYQVCALLLRHGADANRCDWEDQWTPLHLAVYLGNVEIVRLLQGQPFGSIVDNSIVDAKKRTALHLATENDKEHTQRDQEAMIKTLLDNGASVATRDADGNVPLFRACRTSTLGSIYMLVQRAVGDGTVLNYRRGTGEDEKTQSKTSFCNEQTPQERLVSSVTTKAGPHTVQFVRKMLGRSNERQEDIPTSCEDKQEQPTGHGLFERSRPKNTGDIGGDACLPLGGDACLPVTAKTAPCTIRFLRDCKASGWSSERHQVDITISYQEDKQPTGRELIEKAKQKDPWVFYFSPEEEKMIRDWELVLYFKVIMRDVPVQIISHEEFATHGLSKILQQQQERHSPDEVILCKISVRHLTMAESFVWHGRPYA